MKLAFLLFPVCGAAAVALFSPAPIATVNAPATVATASATPPSATPAVESIQAMRDRATQAPERRVWSREPGIGWVEHDSRVSATRALGGMGQGQAATPTPAGSAATRSNWGWESKSPLDPPARR